MTRPHILTIALRTGMLVLFCAATAAAEPPAAVPDAAEDRARSSFSTFAKDWMVKVKRTADSARDKPTIRPGADSPMVSYRGYADDFNVELRPTGHATAPYVGILRYSEQIYSCLDTAATQCRVTSTVPVTEIFRYQNGRWMY